MDINKRVKIARKKLGLSQYEFAEKIHIKQSTLSLIESNKRNITERILKIISLEYNLSLQWLKTGNGEMFNQTCDMNTISAEDKNTLDNYINLNKKDKEIVSSMILSLKKNNEMNKKLIPLLGNTAAGKPLDAYENPDEYIIDERGLADFALRAKGKSMEPDITNGDILFIKRQFMLENGETGIIEIEENGEFTTTCKIFFKNNDKLVLRSINEEFTDMVYSGTKQHIRILGKLLYTAKETYAH